MSILTLYLTLHSIGFVLWTGMGLLLPLVILPVIRSMEESRQAKVLGGITRKYLTWFILGGLAVGATGWAQTFIMFDAFGHQPIIYIKHVAVLLLVFVSAYVWFFLAPKLSKSQPISTGMWKQMWMLAWVQAALSAATLFLCAWMIT